LSSISKLNYIPFSRLPLIDKRGLWELIRAWAEENVKAGRMKID
jgi:hypothetical protein